MYRYQIVILPMAEDDIVRNTDYIAYDKRSPATAIQLSRGLHKAIRNLEFIPGRHELDEDEELAAYGVCKHYYKIYYWINEDEKAVYILSVLHMLVDSKAIMLKRI